MFSKYYQQELYHLRRLASEFAEVHPAIAPMLGTQSADPDVERLLEGTAFLSGLLREKIDDQFPELIHALTHFIFPQFLRSVPSTTIVRFTPRRGMQESILVPAGTEMESVPVEDVSCIFQTSFDCLVHPLEITDISIIGSESRGHRIDLTFRLTGPDLQAWFPETLTFFIGGSYSRASDLFYLLARRLKKITVQSMDAKRRIVLEASSLKPAGFSRDRKMLPYPGNAFSGYRILQEFFLLPHKFLFFELHGLKDWKDRGRGDKFLISFEISPSTVRIDGVSKDSFLLSTVPAINIYRHNAEPVPLDHTMDKIRITPALRSGKRPEIYSIEQVTGFTRGAMKQVNYVEASRFSSEKNIHMYSTVHSMSPVYNRPEISLQFTYPDEEAPLVEETLTIELICTDGDLPRQLKPGDICLPTSSTPELIEFTNLIQPTMPIDPPLEGDLLWRLLSQLSLNLLSLADRDNLRELLGLYISSQDRDKGRISSNRKRIDGIEEFSVTQESFMARGHMLRGQKIKMIARGDHFASRGDFCLFGMVMDNFFAEYCCFNSFTQFELTDNVSGETYTWPIRVGSKPLI